MYNHLVMLIRVNFGQYQYAQEGGQKLEELGKVKGAEWKGCGVPFERRLWFFPCARRWGRVYSAILDLSPPASASQHLVKTMPLGIVCNAELIKSPGPYVNRAGKGLHRYAYQTGPLPVDGNKIEIRH